MEPCQGRIIQLKRGGTGQHLFPLVCLPEKISEAYFPVSQIITAGQITPVPLFPVFVKNQAGRHINNLEGADRLLNLMAAATKLKFISGDKITDLGLFHYKAVPSLCALIISQGKKGELSLFLQREPFLLGNGVQGKELIIHQVSGSVTMPVQLGQGIFIAVFESAAVFHLNFPPLIVEKNPGKLQCLFWLQRDVEHGQLIQQFPGMKTGREELKDWFLLFFPFLSLRRAVQPIASILIPADCKFFFRQLQKEEPGQVHPQGGIPVLFFTPGTKAVQIPFTCGGNQVGQVFAKGVQGVLTTDHARFYPAILHGYLIQGE